jgi:hypothetical protein
MVDVREAIRRSRANRVPGVGFEDGTSINEYRFPRLVDLSPLSGMRLQTWEQ